MAITSLEITVVATHKNFGDAAKETLDFDLMTYNSFEELKEAIREELDNLEAPFEGADTGADAWEYYVETWGDVHHNYQSLDKDLYDYVNAIDSTRYDKDVVDAAIDCGVSIENIDNAYYGGFNSDEDFVKNLLTYIGTIPDNLPSYVHIDWEATARDVMQDYIESSGHYFRYL